MKITIPCLGSSRLAIQHKMYHWSKDIPEFGKCAFGCGYVGRVTNDGRIYRHVPRKYEMIGGRDWYYTWGRMV